MWSERALSARTPPGTGETERDGAGWLAFVRSLVARGLTGVQLAISDAHPGLRAALAATLPGAAWQRCRTCPQQPAWPQVAA